MIRGASFGAIDHWPGEPVALSAVPGMVRRLERLADELELDIARDDDARRHPRREAKLLP